MTDLQKNCSPLGTLFPSVTLSLTARAKELKKQGFDVCSMSVGEPDFDTPNKIKEACINALNSGKVGYIAASGLPELKEAVVKKFATNGITTKTENIIITTGAKFALFQSICALCGQGDEVIVFAPYWVSYLEMIKASGATAVVVETKAGNGFVPCKDDIEKAITAKTKLILINTPNNPTGAVYPQKTLEDIAKLAVKNNLMVLSDEVYEKLVYNGNKHISIASLNDKIADLTITVNGFSKSFAMTGWRLGYLTAPLWLAKRISALQSHATSNATTFVQYAGLEALSGSVDKEIADMVATFDKRRQILCELLKQIPQITFNIPNGAFYIMCNVAQTGMSGDEFAQKLLDEKKVVVIPCTSFGAKDFVRLSYACSETIIREAVTRIKDFCQNK